MKKWLKGPIGKIDTLYVLLKQRAGASTDNWFEKCGRPETANAPSELQAAAKAPIFSLLGQAAKW